MCFPYLFPRGLKTVRPLPKRRPEQCVLVGSEAPFRLPLSGSRDLGGAGWGRPWPLAMVLTPGGSRGSRSVVPGAPCPGPAPSMPGTLVLERTVGDSRRPSAGVRGALPCAAPKLGVRQPVLGHLLSRRPPQHLRSSDLYVEKEGRDRTLSTPASRGGRGEFGAVPSAGLGGEPDPGTAGRTPQGRRVAEGPFCTRSVPLAPSATTPPGL